ncbi:MAG: hypothetical protein JW708_08410 [Vallitaleaceae bacterium]|nr:hypothetical protein [Vallitaleaceae bacterium]
MNHLFRGKRIDQSELPKALDLLESTIEKDLLLPPLDCEIVISAMECLLKESHLHAYDQELIASGIPTWKTHQFMEAILASTHQEALRTKIQRELGEEINLWSEIEEGVFERRIPLGVLLHIGAGNVIALSALSVLEGLISGNINILKLPSYEGGISLRLLEDLVRIEPRLAPYIYVFDISSKETKILTFLGNIADAAVVWGSDEAIMGIRKIAPPTLKIIEWGHKLSFAYFAVMNKYDEFIYHLAEEICKSDQQFCSSPQCIFLETDSEQALHDFGQKLIHSLKQASNKFPASTRSIHEQAEITWTKEMVKMNSLHDGQYLFEDDSKDYSVLIDPKAKLRTSPLFRNIWLMPIERKNMMSIIRPHYGHLQTVGLACEMKDLEELSELFYKAGVNRVTSISNMSTTYIGEPHDGKPTLLQYTRKVSRRM